jgi:hypothetical protein
MPLILCWKKIKQIDPSSRKALKKVILPVSCQRINQSCAFNITEPGPTLVLLLSFASAVRDILLVYPRT